MNAVRLLAVSGLVVALSGCLLLKEPPVVQMYRFGADTGPAATLPINAPSVSLRLVELPEAARTDRMLGVTGNQAAYIAGARWVTPAPALYSDSLEAAFANQARRVRLIGGREGVRADQTLDIDVHAFEARYEVPGAAPVIVLTARARLTRDRDILAEQTFAVRQPASENRLETIVQAFETATRDLNSQIVGWVDTNATVDPRS